MKNNNYNYIAYFECLTYKYANFTYGKIYKSIRHFVIACGKLKNTPVDFYIRDDDMDVIGNIESNKHFKMIYLECREEII